MILNSRLVLVRSRRLFFCRRSGAQGAGLIGSGSSSIRIINHTHTGKPNPCSNDNFRPRFVDQSCYTLLQIFTSRKSILLLNLLVFIFLRFPVARNHCESYCWFLKSLKIEVFYCQTDTNSVKWFIRLGFDIRYSIFCGSL